MLPTAQSGTPSCSASVTHVSPAWITGSFSPSSLSVPISATSTSASGVSDATASAGASSAPSSVAASSSSAVSSSVVSVASSSGVSSSGVDAADLLLDLCATLLTSLPLQSLFCCGRDFTANHRAVTDRVGVLPLALRLHLGDAIVHLAPEMLRYVGVWHQALALVSGSALGWRTWRLVMPPPIMSGMFVVCLVCAGGSAVFGGGGGVPFAPPTCCCPAGGPPGAPFAACSIAACCCCCWAKNCWCMATCSSNSLGIPG